MVLALWQFFVLFGFAAADPVTLVQDPEILARLDLPLARFLAAPGNPDNGALYQQSAAYRALVDSLGEDLAAEKAADPRLDTTMAKIHRLFDVRWLKSPRARFELIGVVNRLDRRPFNPEHCGEVRLIYRLGYRTEKGLESRLPMTVNVVHWVDAPDCSAAAKRWVLNPGPELTSATGPLRPEALSATQLKSVEVNLQSVRWPSTTRGDLGGHAEYLLRAFRPAGGGLILDRLENTPDVPRLMGNRVLRDKLKTWIGAHLTELDEGTAVVPPEFLARKVTSVSPRGMNRLANRPFSRLFDAKDFSSLSFAGKKHVRTVKGLFRRLDDLSCVGCHQGRSVAGFHLIGIDRKETLAGNAIAVTGSPHLLRDQPRRIAFVSQLIQGKPVDNSRPLSERALEGEGGYGSHCGLGDESFGPWVCAQGLTCRGVGVSAGDNTVGNCVPNTVEVGDACEVGTMVPHVDSHKDRVVGAKSSSCGEQGLCEVNYVGFPDGMCAVNCEGKGPSVRCGGIAVLAGFNSCLGAGKPFPVCLQDHVRPAGLRACSDNEPCRDDYLCARAAAGGVCLPPYFLFQMRVDGHPKPT